MSYLELCTNDVADNLAVFGEYFSEYLSAPLQP